MARAERLVNDVNAIKKLIVGKSAAADIRPNSVVIPKDAVDGVVERRYRRLVTDERE